MVETVISGKFISYGVSLLGLLFPLVVLVLETISENFRSHVLFFRLCSVCDE
jgi:hypothetical protein